MIQVNEKIVVLNPGDQLPQVTNDSIKLYLGGTMDLVPPRMIGKLNFKRDSLN